MANEHGNGNEQYPNDDEESVEQPSDHASRNDPDLPIQLEPIEAAAQTPIEPERTTSSVHDLDVCPNCGAPLKGPDTVVCLRCGFDLRTLRSIETKRAIEEPAETIAEAHAVASSGKTRLILSYAIIIISWLLLLAGYVAGVRALFPGVEPIVRTGDDGLQHQYISYGNRALGIVKTLIITAAWSACALAGLALFSRLVERPLGKAKHALLHVVAIISAVQLGRYVRFENRSVEWTLESALQIVLFLVLSMALLKLIQRDVITYVLITIMLVLCVHFGSHVLDWAAG